MEFLFFDAAGTILFTREDAESASVTHEEMSFQAVFPYDKAKEILRGMRIGYSDAAGDYQVFEVRKVNTLEPDHSQQITAENIAISELTDEFCLKKEITNKTAAEVLSTSNGLLKNTGWAIGNNTTSNTSSCDIATGDVWSATRTVQQNWNCYIIPRITVNATGITHKYLDISPAGGTWRGVRLSLDKNANEIGVIWDDSKLKTALYAFGAEKNGSALTFADVVWSATSSHPAKPSGKTYLEDPAATAAYGRNGRPRFGYYQNAGITNATTLLEKTWEVLQTVEVPDVTVNATITDLHRLGYVDVPLRLHDTALVEVRPTGVVLQKEIIQYTEDLLDPLQSRLTIGTYIPNIIYINRENNRRTGGGRGSGDSQTFQEYTTENNTIQLSVDSMGLQSLCVGTGAQLDENGNLVVDPDTGYPIFVDGGENLWSNIQQNKTSITTEVYNRQQADSTLSGRITVEAGKITQIVQAVGADGQVTAASIVAAINNGSSEVVISADHIDLQGVVTADSLATDIAEIDELTTQNLLCDYLGVGEDGMNVLGDIIVTGGQVDAASVDTTELIVGGVDCSLIGDAVFSFGTPTASGGQISIPWTKVDGTAGTPITFNIADTAYYQSHVGISSTGSWVWDSNESDYVRQITANNGDTSYVTLPSITVNANTGTNQSFSAYAYGPVSGGTAHDVSLAKSFYLQSDANYVYVTNNNSTPTVGTNVVARIANPGSGTAGIASIADAGWTYSSNNYSNTVTATANDGTTASTAVTLPSITCDAILGTSSSVTVTAYGPAVLGDSYSLTNSGKTFYLKSDNNYVYLTTTNATPSVGTNVVARASNSAQIGIASTGSWAWNGTDQEYERVITPNAGQAAVINLPAISISVGSWAANNTATVTVTGPGGHEINSATVNASSIAGISSIARTNYTNDADTYSGWSTNHSSVSNSYKYLLYTATAKDGSTRTIKINASSTYNAGANSVTMSISRTATSNDADTYSGWATDQSSVASGAKYLLYTVTASNNTTRTIKINALSTYNAGHDSVVLAEVDLNGSSASTSSSKPTTAITKNKTSVSGYKWLQLSDGTWKNLGAFSISNGAVHRTDLYYRVRDDVGDYDYYPLGSGLYYV